MKRNFWANPLLGVSYIFFFYMLGWSIIGTPEKFLSSFIFLVLFSSISILIFTIITRINCSIQGVGVGNGFLIILSFVLGAIDFIGASIIYFGGSPDNTIGVIVSLIILILYLGMLTFRIPLPIKK